VKQQATTQEKLFANDILDERAAPRIHKELSDLNNKQLTF
jgi:hypothetical protein